MTPKPQTRGQKDRKRQGTGRWLSGMLLLGTILSGIHLIQHVRERSQWTALIDEERGQIHLFHVIKSRGPHGEIQGWWYTANSANEWRDEISDFAVDCTEKIIDIGQRVEPVDRRISSAIAVMTCTGETHDHSLNYRVVHGTQPWVLKEQIFAELPFTTRLRMMLANMHAHESRIPPPPPWI